MGLDNIARKNLDSLKKGDVYSWERVHELALNNKIPIEYAISALEQGLEEKIIPRYKELIALAEKTQGDNLSEYFKLNLYIAQETLKNIYENKRTIQYRGLKLSYHLLSHLFRNKKRKDHLRFIPI
ncbi:hypothetical protein CL617_00925 [archaeon]|nr:hypothetical protein [archaeon]|tara:strand:- start:2504 stop:2881 length:378 start_codon:yes stop_codon:yes gene_type:complete